LLEKLNNFQLDLYDLKGLILMKRLTKIALWLSVIGKNFGAWSVTDPYIALWLARILTMIC